MLSEYMYLNAIQHDAKYKCYRIGTEVLFLCYKPQD